MDLNSTRFMLAQMSASSKEAAELLDAGIVWNDSKHVIVSTAHMVGALGGEGGQHFPLPPLEHPMSLLILSNAPAAPAHSFPSLLAGHS